MTHNLNHREPPVQKAGQTGTALPIQPLPSNKKVLWHSPEATGVVVRVAGGETVSKKTSTAALVFFRHGLLPQPAPRTAPPLGLCGSRPPLVQTVEGSRRSVSSSRGRIAPPYHLDPETAEIITRNFSD